MELKGLEGEEFNEIVVTGLISLGSSLNLRTSIAVNSPVRHSDEVAWFLMAGCEFGERVRTAFGCFLHKGVSRAEAVCNDVHVNLLNVKRTAFSANVVRLIVV